MTHRIALALLAVLAGPALAETNLTERPESCEAYLTAVQEGCFAATYFRCSGDGGPFHRVESTVGGTPAMVAEYDDNYNMIGGGTPDGSLTIDIDTAAPRKLLSLATLRETGSATYSETLAMTVQGTGIQMSNQSTVTLLPDPVQIDGRTFQVAEIAIAVTSVPDLGPLSGAVRIFLSDEFGFPVEGQTSSTVNGVAQTTANDPVDLILPGEDGFAEATPGPLCAGIAPQG